MQKLWAWLPLVVGHTSDDDDICVKVVDKVSVVVVEGMVVDQADISTESSNCLFTLGSEAAARCSTVREYQ